MIGGWLSGRIDYFAAFPGVVSSLKWLSQPRKTTIHTVGTKPEPRAGADTTPEFS